MPGKFGSSKNNRRVKGDPGCSSKYPPIISPYSGQEVNDIVALCTSDGSPCHRRERTTKVRPFAPGSFQFAAGVEQQRRRSRSDSWRCIRDFCFVRTSVSVRMVVRPQAGFAAQAFDGGHGVATPLRAGSLFFRRARGDAHRRAPACAEYFAPGIVRMNAKQTTIANCSNSRHSRPRHSNLHGVGPPAELLFVSRARESHFRKDLFWIGSPKIIGSVAMLM